jgi:hypothetical protein
MRCAAGSTAAYRLTLAIVGTYVRSPLPKSVTEAMMANAAAIMTRLDLLCMAGKRRSVPGVPGTPIKISAGGIDFAATTPCRGAARGRRFRDHAVQRAGKSRFNLRKIPTRLAVPASRTNIIGSCASITT